MNRLTEEERLDAYLEAYQEQQEQRIEDAKEIAKWRDWRRE